MLLIRVCVACSDCGFVNSESQAVLCDATRLQCSLTRLSPFHGSMCVCLASGDAIALENLLHALARDFHLRGNLAHIDTLAVHRQNFEVTWGLLFWFGSWLAIVQKNNSAQAGDLRNRLIANTIMQRQLFNGLALSRQFSKANQWVVRFAHGLRLLLGWKDMQHAIKAPVISLELPVSDALNVQLALVGDSSAGHPVADGALGDSCRCCREGLVAVVISKFFWAHGAIMALAIW